MGFSKAETAPWDATEYSQLISSGPLLPLLEQYAGLGMMRANKKKRTVSIFATMKMTFYFCRALPFFSRFL